MDMKNICKTTNKLQFGAIPYNSDGVISFEPNIDKVKKNLVWSYRVKFDGIIKKIKIYYIN